MISKFFPVLLVAGVMAGALAAQTPPYVGVSDLPPGSINSPYASGLTVLGGVAPYTWSLGPGGALPPGLALSPYGIIAGTPTAPGLFQFTLVVTDLTHTSASALLSIVIAGPAPMISTGAALPAGTVGVAYSQTFSGSGGTPPVQWVVDPSFLPPGLTFDTSAGTLTGTPAAAGRYSFTVQLTDYLGAAASVTYSLTIDNPPLAITTASPLTAASVGTPYSSVFEATGGAPPYTWAVSAGSVGEFTLDPASGTLQGTPKNTGKLAFTVQVTDSAAVTAQQSFTLTVNPPALSVVVVALPAGGTTGVAYPQTPLASATGGVPPYTWSITAGSIPGLTFNAELVEFTGTPTTPGSYPFTLQVQDSAGVSATKSMTLKVASGALYITTARQLPNVAFNAPYSLTLQAVGGAPPYTWAATGLPQGLSVNPSTGQVSGTLTGAGTFAIAFMVTDSAQANYSDRFTLNVALPAAPTVTVSGLTAQVSPANQYPLQISLGSAYPADITGQVSLSFTPTSGATDQTIQFAAGGASANFTVPAGKTAAVASVPLAVQTGTVAGSLNLTVKLQAGGADITPSPAPSASAQIAAAAPVVSKVQVTRSSNGISLSITGYSTAREVTQAVFNFSAATGQSLQSTASSIALDVTSVFGSWFQNVSSSQYGSQFVFTQPFNVAGDPNAVIPVSVTLTNHLGSTTASVTQ